MCGLLTLLHAAGELVMMCRMYRPPASNGDHINTDVDELQSDRVNHLAGNIGDGLVDLSSVYSGWSRHRWRKLHQLVSDAQCRHLQLCWVCTHSVTNLYILLTCLFAYFRLGSILNV